MLIGVLNESKHKLVTDEQAATMTRAIATQVRIDAAPIWDRPAAAVIFFTDAASVPPDAHVITIVDTIEDQPTGVLGFHTEDQGGKLWGTVAVLPSLDNDAGVLTGDWSVSSILSHEVLEMFIDPNCNLWASNDKRTAYSFEVCDPVEAPSYEVDGVAVSNFVTPAWFDPLAAERAHSFDKLGLLDAPFTLLKGGYLVSASHGQEKQHYEKYGTGYPAWRRASKRRHGARTKRRLAQAAEIG